MAVKGSVEPKGATENGNTATAAAEGTGESLAVQIELQRVSRRLCRVWIDGTAPLIVNQFGAKARQYMLDKQMGKAGVREPKDPEANFKASLYPLGDGGYGFPATGFKAAIVGSARYFDNKRLSMTLLKQAIFVRGRQTKMDGNVSDLLVPLYNTEDLDAGVAKPGYALPDMREDTVRNETGVADIRHRGQFAPWSALIEVEFISSMFNLGSLAALVDAAGMGGVGEWRPASKKSQTGSYGTWRVRDDRPIEDIAL